MTVAFYISPQGIPAIGADYVVTEEIGTNYRFSSKIGAELSGRGIFNFETNALRNSYSRSHARKTLILDDLTAVAFAGPRYAGEAIIKEFLSRNSTGNERPMRLLGSLAEEWNQRHTTPKQIHFVGANITHQSEGRYEVNFLGSPNQHEPTPSNLGSYKFIGSGLDDYLEKFRVTERQYILTQKPENEIEYAINFIRDSINKVCSDTIFDDYFINDSCPSFGGFLEYCYYNPFERKWVRQPSSLHCFIEVYGDFQIGISSRACSPAIGYHSHEEHSGIIGFSEFENHLIVSAQTLRDPLKQNQFTYSIENWKGWKPEFCTLHFFTKNRGEPESLLVKVLPADAVNFGIFDEYSHLSIDEEVIRSSLEIIARNFPVYFFKY